MCIDGSNVWQLSTGENTLKPQFFLYPKKGTRGYFPGNRFSVFCSQNNLQ